jgi:hypothetical protein
VLASVEAARAGVASGVNNTAARIAQLLVVAGLPLAVGLSGDAYQDAQAVNTSFHRAAVGCALLFALSSAVAAFYVRPHGRRCLRGAPRPMCRSHLGVNAPALEPGSAGARAADGAD